MRKRTILWMGALLMMVINMSSCSSDDDFSNPLLGKWEMENSYIGYNTAEERIYNNIGADEVIVDFQNDGTLQVKSKSEQVVDDYFIPSGNYIYSLTTDTLYLNVGIDYFAKWRYIVENNKLSILLYHDLKSYPGPSIIYIFRKKE